MKAMTKTATSWFDTAAAGLRADQIQALDASARRISDRRRATKVGGNHVLKALLDTGLYQRSWPS